MPELHVIAAGSLIDSVIAEIGIPVGRVDYVIPAGDMVLPLEVKSGATGHLKCMRLFLESRKEISSYGIRLSSHNFSVLSDLHSYPLYAVCLLAASLNNTVRNGIRSLL